MPLLAFAIREEECADDNGVVAEVVAVLLSSVENLLCFVLAFVFCLDNDNDDVDLPGVAKPPPPSVAAPPPPSL